MSILTDFIKTAESFCERQGWGASRFGREVFRDPNFLADIESGQRAPQVSTLEKALAFIDQVDSKKENAHAGVGEDLLD